MWSLNNIGYILWILLCLIWFHAFMNIFYNPNTYRSFVCFLYPSIYTQLQLIYILILLLLLIYFNKLCACFFYQLNKCENAEINIWILVSNKMAWNYLYFYLLIIKHMIIPNSILCPVTHYISSTDVGRVLHLSPKTKNIYQPCS